MSWEETLFTVFDDLEQQAAGLHLSERDAEVADLTLTEYSRISLASRLHASLDRELRVRLVGGHQVQGRLARVGEDWMLLVGRSSQWIVRHQGVTTLDGLSTRADSEETWSVVDRLPLRSVLRGLGGANERCLAHCADNHRVEGRVGRVGRDFFEMAVGDGRGHTVQVLPVTSVSALRGRTG